MLHHTVTLVTELKLNPHLADVRLRKYVRDPLYDKRDRFPRPTVAGHRPCPTHTPIICITYAKLDAGM